MYELSDKLVSLNPNTKENVARRIQDIERSVEKAIEKSQENESEAQDILIDVLKRTQKLIVFMTDFEVSDTIDIEELVPVVLTSDEEVAEITVYKKEIVQKRADIDALLNETEKNSDFTDKIENGLGKIDALVIAINESTTFSEIKAYAIEAIALADDMQLLLESDSAVGTGTEVPDQTLIQSTSTASSTASTSIAELPDSQRATTSSNTIGVSTTSASAQ
jgi:hypothetical protein